MIGRMMNSFYYGKSGKGDFNKDDLPKNRWQLFWEMLRVRLAALFRLNLMSIIAWIPLIIVIGSCIGKMINVMVITTDYSNYVATGGADMGNLTEEQIAALTAEDFDLQTASVGVISEAIYSMLLYAIPCIAVTGPFKAGMAYVTRNWARDEHAFIWSDFKDAVKENWKQALGVSIISGLLPFIIYVAWQFYGQQRGTMGIAIVPQFLVVSLGLVWALACEYLYPMLVTYKVSFKDLVRNGLFMAVGRLPQSVGIRLLLLFPTALAFVLFFLIGSPIVLLIWGAYYVVFGFAFARFIIASYTNGVFDKFVNSHMEGVEINRGLAKEEEDDEEEAAAALENGPDEPNA